jgi:hypothetical protein
MRCAAGKRRHLDFSLDQTPPLSRFRLPDGERVSKNEAKHHGEPVVSLASALPNKATPAGLKEKNERRKKAVDKQKEKAKVTAPLTTERTPRGGQRQQNRETRVRARSARSLKTGLYAYEGHRKVSRI